MIFTNNYFHHFLKWGLFLSAWITDAIYIQSTLINVFNSGFDPQYTFKFGKIWIWIKYIIIWQQKEMISIFMVPIWMPRKNNTSISTKITNPSLTS